MNLFKNVKYDINIYGTMNAKFPTKWIENLYKKVNGDLRIHLKDVLDDSRRISIFKKDFVYLNKFQVDWIIECIKEYNKTGIWRDCSKSL